jgi:hypothetical protein
MIVHRRMVGRDFFGRIMTPAGFLPSWEDKVFFDNFNSSIRFEYPRYLFEQGRPFVFGNSTCNTANMDEIKMVIWEI